MTDIWSDLTSAQDATMLLRLTEEEAVALVSVLVHCPDDDPYKEQAKELADRAAYEYFDTFELPDQS